MSPKDVQIRAIRTGNVWIVEVVIRDGKKRETFCGNQTPWTRATYSNFDGALEAGVILARFECTEGGVKTSDLDERIFRSLMGSKEAKPSDWNTDGDVPVDRWNRDGDVPADKLTGGAA